MKAALRTAGSRDHVALAQLWGAMPALPREIPRFTKDLRQRWDDLGRPHLPDRAEPPAPAQLSTAGCRAIGRLAAR